MKITGLESIEAVMKELGVRIKGIRIRRGITREELADNATVSFSTLTRVENGEGCSLENLCRIMQALGVMGNFQDLLKEYEPTPEELYEGRTLPKRFRKSKKEESEWKWGDE